MIPAIEALAVSAVISRLFYDSLTAFVLLLPLSAVMYRKKILEEEEKRKRILAMQFRDMLASLITAYRTGYSAENAFIEAYHDMRRQYGDAAPVSAELSQIACGIQNRIPLDRLLSEFAGRTQIEEILEFSDIYRVACASGGNMVEILTRTERMIRGRMEVENEIAILTAGRRMEQKIMSIVPFAIIAYISLTSKGYFDVVYHNPEGIAVMTICLAVYLGACVIAEKAAAIAV